MALTTLLTTLIFMPTMQGETAHPQPPLAKVQPHRLEAHGHVRDDPYFWLKDRENPEVIAYLEAENTYTQAQLAHTKTLQDRLFEEIKGRVKEDDLSAPYRIGEWWYYRRTEAGKPYPSYCRKHLSLDADEQVILDVDALATAHGYFSVRAVEPNDSQNILAYAADNLGRRKYTIYFKDLATGDLLPDKIEEVTGNVAWASDDETLFYSRQDPETLRSHRIYRHVVGTDPAEDTLVFEEKDETYRCFVTRTRSHRYLLITSSQTLHTEVRYLAADDPTGEWRVFEPRGGDHDYRVDHWGDRWLIRTNWKARNFRAMTTAIDATGKEHWTELLPARADVFLVGTSAFADFAIATERRQGLVRLRIVPKSGEASHTIDFGEAAYSASLGTNPNYDVDEVRYDYTSMTTPPSVYDYAIATRKKVLRKRDEVVGDFDPADWVTERLAAPARDGVKIPISIVYRKGMAKDRSSPLLLYAYGSYGATVDATFNSARLSLLERGFAFAIAHVRGSQVNGREWYEDGKLLRKRNTFTDFIDAGEFLIAEGYTNKDRLFARGGSAGGLLIGAVVNMRPDLFAGAIADVPFVDVVTTMLDDSIPLTTSEYDEWGDPRKKDYYDYMLSYSPYDNVTDQRYPPMLVTTGLHDSQVQYWEPAKWVAKLRTMPAADRRLLLKTNMLAGHGGASGRYERYREVALDYAFLLDLAGIKD